MDVPHLGAIITRRVIHSLVFALVAADKVVIVSVQDPIGQALCSSREVHVKLPSRVHGINRLTPGANIVKCSIRASAAFVQADIVDSLVKGAELFTRASVSLGDIATGCLPHSVPIT